MFSPSYLANNKITTAGLVAVILILLILGWWASTKKTDTEAIFVNDIKEELLFIRLLDGVPVATFKEASARPIAVIIDNSFDARPSSGLEQAGLVYETIAEGAITRLVAFFTMNTLPVKVGPIRSLRPYFITWADEVNAIMAHVGGSPEALKEIKKFDNINEFYKGDYFFRDKTRRAPHNIYTSGELLNEVIKNLEYSTITDIKSWLYETSSAEVVENGPANFTVNFSLGPYEVKWIYNTDSKTYIRTLSKSNILIKVANVVVQVVEAEVLDSELRRHLYLEGEGKAWVFSRGQMIVGRWQKNNSKSKTRFFNSQGEEIAFSPGTTWIEVIDDEGRISF